MGEQEQRRKKKKRKGLIKENGEKGKRKGHEHMST